MAENTIRMSQLVGMFGPGAMLDLPDRSVLVLGLDQWEMQGKGTFQKIEEPRLQRLLHLRLKEDDRIVWRQAAGTPNAADQQAGSQDAVAGGSRDGVSALVCMRRAARRHAQPSPARPISGPGAAEACPLHRPRRQEARGLADPVCVRLRERSSSRHRLAPRGPPELAGRGEGRGGTGRRMPQGDVAGRFGTSADPRDTRITANAGRHCRWRSCSNPAGWASAPANGRGSRSTIVTRTAATRPCGF